MTKRSKRTKLPTLGAPLYVRLTAEQHAAVFDHVKREGISSVSEWLRGLVKKELANA